MSIYTIAMSDLGDTLMTLSLKAKEKRYLLFSNKILIKAGKELIYY